MTSGASTLRAALVQMNPTVGDLDGNAELVRAAAVEAVAAGARLVLAPEMALTGYPVEDLALRPAFRAASAEKVADLAVALADSGAGEALVVAGFVAQDGPVIRNAAAVLHRGEVAAVINKHHLPNYGVFDENRWFTPGESTTIIGWRGLAIGVAVCEDIWQVGGPATALAEAGIDLLLVPNASPYERGKQERRLEVTRGRAAEAGAPVLYTNMVGGQDDLVFDGQSHAVAPDGTLLAQARAFESALLLVDLDLAGMSGLARPAGRYSEIAVDRVELTGPDVGLPREDPTPMAPAAGVTAVTAVTAVGAREAPANPVAEPLSGEAEVWQALVTGLRDYTDKTGFGSVILGLSGGIDSAVVAAIAVDALGADRVYGVSMPSAYSSGHSRDDAADLAARTGLHYRVEPIADMVSVFTRQLALTGVAEENVQARCRGVLLMGLSNAEGHLVLATGNKTELACGYSTIYGDAVGGFAPLKDVYKTLVWELARWRNKAAAEAGQVPPIPENSISKPPSAELRPGQLDSDSLPDYALLDAILAEYVDADAAVHDFDPATVARVVHLVDRAEWKRRQYPPGPKISGKAFGRDRRLPIVNGWGRS